MTAFISFHFIAILRPAYMYVHTCTAAQDIRQRWTTVDLDLPAHVFCTLTLLMALGCSTFPCKCLFTC